MSTSPRTASLSPYRAVAAALFIVAIQAPFAGDANAKEFSVKHVSESSLKRSCKKAGGAFYSDLGEYTCTNSKKGTSVSCNKDKCTGTTKDAPRPRHLREPKSAERLPGITRETERASPQRDRPVVTRDIEHADPRKVLRRPIRRIE